jgi:hypothetical protein
MEPRGRSIGASLCSATSVALWIALLAAICLAAICAISAREALDAATGIGEADRSVAGAVGAAHAADAEALRRVAHRGAATASSAIGDASDAGWRAPVSGHVAHLAVGAVGRHETLDTPPSRDVADAAGRHAVRGRDAGPAGATNTCATRSSTSSASSAVAARSGWVATCSGWVATCSGRVATCSRCVAAQSGRAASRIRRRTARSPAASRRARACARVGRLTGYTAIVAAAASSGGRKARQSENEEKSHWGNLSVRTMRARDRAGPRASLPSDARSDRYRRASASCTAEVVRESSRVSTVFAWNRTSAAAVRPDA